MSARQLVRWLTWLLPLAASCGFDLFDDSPPLGEQVDLSELPSCQAVAEWDPEWVAFEGEVLRLTNLARARGHDCDSAGRFGPSGPLVMNDRLRCAARVHSLYMASTGEFAHDESQNGSDPFERMASAGYEFSAAGENIAAGQRSPQEVVAGWLESDGHCANIMLPAYRELGVGFALGDGAALGFRGDAPYWTQAFGAPR